ncbi:hypothetical protein N7471_000888 [Penicillium samsonianum]|uniref:uncharacterized protein n=1 Tax=Penicillium samsonianum TaxID=1882272 RepID=UPI002548E057|nr:uncharacterized protein N7471_000888 [Penicillium samsonianum]KAJ6149689.1 hypothetical protein N7471_000888 [Penicillium samsonianum]
MHLWCTASFTKNQRRSIQRFEFFAPRFDIRVWVFMLSVDEAWTVADSNFWELLSVKTELGQLPR